MKKFAMKALSLSLIMTLFITYVSADTYDRDDAIREFKEIQEKIDSVVEVVDSKYIYNITEITNIIDSYDFNRIAEIANLPYTKETFTAEVLGRLETTEVNLVDFTNSNSNIMARWITGRICGVTATENRWNSERTFETKAQAELQVYQMRDYARTIAALYAAGAVVTISVPPLVGIFGIVGGAAAWYYDGVAGWLEYHNNKGNCGLVIDINRFTFYYEIWNQNVHHTK